MRAWHKWTIALLILIGLLVGADRLAVKVVEDKAADKLVSSGRLSVRPQVSIEGFPFLTQVLDKKLNSVHLSSDTLQLSSDGRTVELSSFSAQLNGVRVNDSYSPTTVDSGTAVAVLSYTEASKLLGYAADFSFGGPGQVKASVAGGLATVQGKVHSKGNTIIADDFQLGGLGSLVSGAANEFTQPKTFELNRLPAGLNLESATPEQEGLKLTFSGSNLSLTG